MKLLFVHECLGGLAEAEANICKLATGLKRCGHRLGLLHSPVIGKSAADWRAVFDDRFSLLAHGVWAVCQHFCPDVICVHNVADLRVLEALLDMDVPRVRMVHNHTDRSSLGWATYWARKKEMKLNRRFHRLVVDSNRMKQELLRDGFARDRIVVHRPVENSIRKLEEMFARVLLTTNHPQS